MSINYYCFYIAFGKVYTNDKAWCKQNMSGVKQIKKYKLNNILLLTKNAANKSLIQKKNYKIFPYTMRVPGNFVHTVQFLAIMKKNPAWIVVVQGN